MSERYALGLQYVYGTNRLGDQITHEERAISLARAELKRRAGVLPSKLNMKELFHGKLYFANIGELYRLAEEKHRGIYTTDIEADITNRYKQIEKLEKERTSLEDYLNNQRRLLDEEKLKR